MFSLRMYVTNNTRCVCDCIMCLYGIDILLICDIHHGDQLKITPMFVTQTIGIFMGWINVISQTLIYSLPSGDLLQQKYKRRETPKPSLPQIVTCAYFNHTVFLSTCKWRWHTSWIPPTNYTRTDTHTHTHTPRKQLSNWKIYLLYHTFNVDCNTRHTF